ncbi:hypothetical protein PHM1_076 [Eurybiavirus PHM1]|uniref:Uncharacterized protein n=1 Tax=Prochlorococcus phage P-HM1 TaxID=445700 RepID=E3SMQ7_9CAUD|nr:hypothetical protein PHM1_076 [Prochlorococcus phage P-HM1]ADO98700.1 hypothetical protein PHM1_076 [Prochlorococcus phage P-HM1]
MSNAFVEALPQLMVLVSLSRTSTHISPLDALEVLRLARPRASPQPSSRGGGSFKGVPETTIYKVWETRAKK